MAKPQRVYSFSEAITALKDGRTVTPRDVLGLSGLSSEQFAVFQDVWEELPADRRAEAMERLRDVDLDSAEYTFTPIFRLGMADKDERVRVLAVEGLFQDDSPVLIEPLIRMLRDDESTFVKAAVATALGEFLRMGELEEISKIRRDKVYSALIGAWAKAGHNSVLASRVLQSLGHADNEEVGLLIEEAFASGNEDMRLAALVAMGRSMNEKYGPQVVASLASDSSEIRAAAAEVSGELLLDDAVAELGKLIYDRDEAVRLAAIAALGEIASDDACAWLVRAGDSKDPVVVDAAEEALETAQLVGDVRKLLDNMPDDVGE